MRPSAKAEPSSITLSRSCGSRFLTEIDYLLKWVSFAKQYRQYIDHSLGSYLATKSVTKLIYKGYHIPCHCFGVKWLLCLITKDTAPMLPSPVADLLELKELKSALNNLITIQISRVRSCRQLSGKGQRHVFCVDPPIYNEHAIM